MNENIKLNLYKSFNILDARLNLFRTFYLEILYFINLFF